MNTYLKLRRPVGVHRMDTPILYRAFTVLSAVAEWIKTNPEHPYLEVWMDYIPLHNEKRDMHQLVLALESYIPLHAIKLDYHEPTKCWRLTIDHTMCPSNFEYEVETVTK